MTVRLSNLEQALLIGRIQSGDTAVAVARQFGVHVLGDGLGGISFIENPDLVISNGNLSSLRYRDEVLANHVLAYHTAMGFNW